MRVLRQAKPGPRPPALTDLDGLFKGFADPTRIRILNVLAAGELCVRDIVALLRLAQPTVSRHLAYLRRTGLARARPELKYTYYRLADPQDAIHRNLLGCVRTCFRGIGALDRERAAAETRVTERQTSPCV
ncbi:MAG TPA: metalloregulator ArsR/SmtB family transcription factor [Gemmatimonadales bacterium]|nr:metalloregulator ArsR/SmtB family transcription factor [Gemmatimonadales bacterium]